MKKMTTATLPAKRIVWAFALGYFLAYIPYAAVVKIATSGADRVEGLEFLPATLFGTVVAVLAGMIVLGWWRYLRVVRDPRVIASGVAAALIIAATTMAYTFAGISIVFALLLLRGGVLILAPIVDLAMGRSVRWFCWSALILALAALTLALMRVGNYTLTLAAGITVGIYLTGYIVRLPAMTKMAKVRDRELTRQFFVDEIAVAMLTLILVPLAMALLPLGDLSDALRRGMTSFPPMAIVAGVCYAVLYFFGTHIYLDYRENTFCIPLNRGSSLLAGIVASAIATASGVAWPSSTELVAAAMMIGALLFLSPFHHLFEPERWPRPLRRLLFLPPLPERGNAKSEV
jgi:hypothetical protein